MPEQPTQPDGLHARLDELATYLHRQQVAQDGRIRRGLLALQLKLRKLPGPGIDRGEKVDPKVKEEAAIFFGKQKTALQAAVRDALPAELERTLRTARWALRGMVVLMALVALTMAGAHFTIQKQLMARTPTPSLIEMMLKGWEVMRRETPKGGE